MGLCHLVSREFLPFAEPLPASQQNAENYNLLTSQNSQGRMLSVRPQFVDQECLWQQHGRRLSYDRAVVELGSIPSRRGNLHDYFNFFTWLRFPRSKAVLHAHQFRLQEARRAKGQPNRSAEEDKLTLLDEGGILRVQFNNIDAPEERCIKHLIFGHGVLEQYHLGKTDFSGFGLELEGDWVWLESQSVPMENYLDAALEQLLQVGIKLPTRAIGIRLQELLLPEI